MNCLTKFYKEHKTFFIPITAVIVIAIALLFSHVYRPEIISGLFLLLAAIIAAPIAIHQYQIQQRTLRLQNILFVYVQENYCLIERHYILFSLLSEIVLEFSSESYATIQKILKRKEL